MIRYLPCGWDSQRRLVKHGGCGVWVGYLPIPCLPYLPVQPRKSHIRNGSPYCENCVKGFDVRHLGQGVCVRPAEESDVPVGGPGLTELY